MRPSVDAVIVLGKELRRHPARGLRELRARAAAASVAHRQGAHTIFSLEARLRGQERSGSELVVEALEELGVDAGAVVVGERTRSTREEAVVALEEARRRDLRRLAVLTHGYHVPRVRRYFAEAFEPGRYTVLTPEAFLQRARGRERDWIEAATPDAAVFAEERVPELLFGALGALLRPLPRRLRWKAEIEVAGLYRSVS